MSNSFDPVDNFDPIDYQSLDYVKINDSVTLNSNRVWLNKGHNLGEGMLSPDNKYFYLNIPKNASSNIKKALLDAGWGYASLSDWPETKILVVLNDPVERWIGGITQYLSIYHNDIIDNIIGDAEIYGYLPLTGEKLALSLIFDRLTFDDHTERQAIFLNDILLSRCIWVMIDENFNKNFTKLLNELGYTFDENLLINPVKTNRLKDFINYIVTHDKFKRANIELWHWCDYKLINEMKFYD